MPKLPVNKIVCGDVKVILPQIQAETFNCIITSPPYWGLRAYKTTPVIWGGQKDCRHNFMKPETKTFDYKTSAGPSAKNPKSTLTKSSKLQASHTVEMGTFCSLCPAWRGELGLEPTIELYIEHLMMVMNECKRVLRPDGVMFINIGDTYYGGGGGNQYSPANTGILAKAFKANPAYEEAGGFDYAYRRKSKTMQAKSLCNIPEKFCLAMEKQGWIKRCNIIWAKGFSFANNLCPQCGLEVQYSGSCMPDSAKDRPNHNGFEWVYMFTKSKKYWYEQQYEQAQELNAERPRMGQGNQTIYQQKRGNAPGYDGRKDTTLKPSKKYSQRNISLNGPQQMARGPMERWPNPLGRTIRNVWAINPEPFSDWGYDFNNADYVDGRGIPRKLSPDCPIHSLSLLQQPSNHGETVCDEPANSSLNHSQRNDGCPVSKQVSDSSPKQNCKKNQNEDSRHEQNPKNIDENKTGDHEPDVSGVQRSSHNSRTLKGHETKQDCSLGANSGSATLNSSQSRKNALVDDGVLQDKASEEKSCHKYNKLHQPYQSPNKQLPTIITDRKDKAKCKCNISQTSHFATFPTRLVEICLKMGCPEFVCKKCGKARSKIYDKPMPPQEVLTKTKFGEDDYAYNFIKKGKPVGSGQKYQNWRNENPLTQIGLTDCGCNAGFEPGLCLDPFAGSCTTAVVAYKNKRNYTMIELSEEYVKMGEQRLNCLTGLFDQD